jgi:hypothetical protein
MILLRLERQRQNAQSNVEAAKARTLRKEAFLKVTGRL